VKFKEVVDDGSEKMTLNFGSDLLAGNDTVPIPVWRDGDMRCTECLL